MEFFSYTMGQEKSVNNLLSMYQVTIRMFRDRSLLEERDRADSAVAFALLGWVAFSEFCCLLHVLFHSSPFRQAG